MRISKAYRRLRSLAILLGLALVACSDVDPIGPIGGLEESAPRPIINGVDDFDRSAVAAIMVYQPTFPADPGWRAFCSATLIHKRVLTTAGHCVQGLEALLAAGLIEAVWISFQQDPEAHFNEDPAEADPVTGGWYEIELLHDNPDNPDFLALFAELAQGPPVPPIWGNFHDSGAITLKTKVKGIQPMKTPVRPGEVDILLANAGCDSQTPGCGLVGVGYGLTGFPPPTFAPPQARMSAALAFKGVDPLFIGMFSRGMLPGPGFGAVCFGDSGGAIVLQKRKWKDRTLVAISSSPEDPFAFPCTNADIHYRTDTKSHLAFIKGVILQSLRG